MSAEPTATRRVHEYHAEAFCTHGHFYRPIRHELKPKSSAALPKEGGFFHEEAEGYRFHGLFSHRGSYSHVAGNRSLKPDHGWVTLATSVIEGLNIMDVVTADRIVSRLTSSHNIKEEEGHIIALGSTFDNFRVGGYRFDFVLRHEVLMKAKTHEALVKAVTSDRKQGKIAAHLHGATICSLVEEIKTDFPGLSDEDKKKHIVQIPNFGTLSFAEVFSACGTKTLTMLRFDLGSPDGGGGSAGGTSTNGRPSPPVG